MARTVVGTGPVWSTLGFNYGSDVVYSTSADIAQATTDLAAMKPRANRIRFHIPPFDIGASVEGHCLEVIDLAKSMGFKVIWGVTANPTVLTSSNWPAYRLAALARAALAQQHGIDEFTVGNEDEYRIDGTTLPIATFRSNINTLAGEVKGVFSGTVSYTVSHNHTFGWIALGLGNLDKIGLNIYGSSAYDHRFFIYILTTFYAAFGSAMYLGEFNITDSWAALVMTDDEQTNALRDRIRYIRSVGVVEAYFFTYCHASTDEFAVRLADGTFRKMWNVFAQDRWMSTRGAM